MVVEVAVLFWLRSWASANSDGRCELEEEGRSEAQRRYEQVTIKILMLMHLSSELDL